MSKNLILVTGANGFIGQHLCRRLLKDGQKVLALIKDRDKDEIPSHKKLKKIYGDITDKKFLKENLKGIKVVFHLAAIARLQYNYTEKDYFKINVTGTKNLLEVAHENKIKRFVYISTIEAVGPADGVNPLDEKTPPHPVNIYGKTKLQAERLVLKYYKTKRLPVTIIRLPMVYGPGNMLIFSRLFKLVSKGIYPLIGRKEIIMEFCNIHNAIHGMLLAERLKKAIGEIFFINDGRSYSIKEVLMAAAKAQNVNLRFFIIPIWFAYTIGFVIEVCAKIFPFPPLVMPQTKKPFFSRGTVSWTTKSVNMCSSKKAKMLLGYKPVVSLAKGVKEAVSWYRKRGCLK